MPANPFAALGDEKPKELNPLDMLGGGGPNPPVGGGGPNPPVGGGGANPPGGVGALDRGAVQPVGGGLDASPVQPQQPPAGGGLDGTPVQPPGTPGAMDPNQVWGNLQNQFQTKFGRAMTAEEATALQGYAGYSPGGQINQGMIDKATQGIGSYTGDIKNPFGAAGGGTTPTPQTPGIKTDDLAQQELQKLLTTGSTDAMSKVDMNNPAIRAQKDAFNRQNEQARTRERMAAAERGAAGNQLGAGGYNADIAAAERGAGDRAVNFESQLMTQELAGQRERVQNALNMALQSGNQAQARALQEKLGTMDIQLRGQLGKGQLNLGLLQALMGDQRSKDALGLGYAQLGQQGNLGLLNAILGAGGQV